MALGTSCTAIAANSFNAGCVADDGADGQYTKGAGPILVIDGTFGRGLYNVSGGDSEGGYFARLMGANLTAAHGFVKYTVTTTSLSAQFVRSSGAAFTDSFTIAGTGGGGGGGGGNTAPTASAVSASTVTGSPVTATMRGTDAETCDLAFMIESQPAHGTLSPIADNPCTAGAPNIDTALVTYTPAAGFTGTDSFQYQVSDGVLPSNLATVTITVAPSGGGGTLTQPFPAAADASIYGDTATNRGTNFGTAQTLEVDASPVKRFLIKFDVTGVTGRTVTGIRLHLTCANSSSRGGDFRPTATNTWIESGSGGVTWNNQPAFNAAAAPLASLGSVSSGTAYDVVLPASFITGDGTYSLVVTSTSSDGADYWSKERGGTLAPQLLVRTTGSGGPPPLSSLSINNTSVTEGNAGTVNANFTVTLSPATSQMASVFLETVADTAMEDVDFMGTDGTLAFAPGETTKTVSVAVAGDTTTEPNETFFVNLSGAVNATIADGQGVGTIVDDDGTTPPPPAVLPFPAAADASIYGDTATNRGTNFGPAQTLEVDASPVKRFLIKFDVTGVTGRTVTGIRLHLTCANSSSRGGDFRPTPPTPGSRAGRGA